MADKIKVLHKRSVEKGKVPSGDTLGYGEIAINYNAEAPFLSIKDSNNNYRKFIDETTIDEKLSDFSSVISDVPFEKGNAENSVVLKGGDNQAISKNSVAMGNNNIAGLKGWYYGSINKIDDTTIDVYISDSQRGSLNYPIWGETTKLSNLNPYSVLGDNTVVSLINDIKYDNKFKVIGGEDGRIRLQTVSGNLPFNSIAIELVLDPEDYSIYCLSNPTAGVADVSLSSVAEGRSTKALGACSHAEGYNTTAYGKYSHVEGRDTEALYIAHAEGSQTKAIGNASHSEGTSTQALNSNAHAEGFETEVRGYAGHAEGKGTKVLSDYGHSEGELTEVSANSNGAHAEGIRTKASNTAAHAEGRNTIAAGLYAHAEGYNEDNNEDYGAFGAISHTEGYATVTTADANSGHAEGRFTTVSGMGAHAEGISNTASGEATHVEGKYTKANGYAAHAEGYGESLENPNLAQGDYSHVEGEKTKTLGMASHAEGGSSVAIGNFSHSEGRFTRAHALCSHAEGFSVEGKEDEYGAFGPISHVEGYANITTSEANSAHAEGRLNTASGMGAHVEGISNIASGEASHAEGENTIASGEASHAEGGGGAVASGECSHAEGSGTIASGDCSHAEGAGAIAYNFAEHAEGICNKSNTNTIHSVGVGTSETDRKNAHEIMRDGKHYIYGIGGYDGTNPDTSYDLATCLPNMVNITYDDLVTLRDHSLLIPGQQYRITDYVTTTTQTDTQSAGHQFDIIVTADDESTLNEVARAIQHEGDTYFADSDVNAWKIWYCLDNDTERFNWANNKGDYAIHVPVSDSMREFLQNWSHLNPSIPDTLIFTWWDNPRNGSDWGLDMYNATNFKLAADDILMIVFPCGTIPQSDVAFNEIISKSDGTELPGNRFYLNGQPTDVDGVIDTLPTVIKNNIGKGVIYRMIDEFNNDCPYDFKNIQFKRKLTDGVLDTENGVDTWCYTFNAYCIDNTNIYDASVIAQKEEIDDDANRCYGNIIKEYYGDSSNVGLILNDIVFLNIYSIEGANFFGCDSNSFGSDCYDNSFGTGCYDNSFGNSCHRNSFEDTCYYNSFGNSCYSNSFGSDCSYNSFGDDCSSNSFGNSCFSNSFGTRCRSNSFGSDCDYNSFGSGCNSNSFGYECIFNSFGNSCSSNSFGDVCRYNAFGSGCDYNSFGDYCEFNSFGNYCYRNSFGNECYSNSFGNQCYRNSFGDYCEFNSFGNNCYYNSFGNQCYSNSFGNGCHDNSFRVSASTASSLKKFVYYNHFDDGCSYNVIWNSGTTSSSVKLKNINVNRGVCGTSNSYNYININTLNSEKEINVINYNDHIYIDYGDIFNVTYSELWILRENSQLIPGRQYRITDYVTTTSQENTQSAGHPFDIIVTALDEYTLSEEAQAIQNINDGYFDESNLSAWKIWYSIDSDTNRFEWAGNERIETVIVEGVDTSNCTISVGYTYDNEEGLNKFDNRIQFVSQVWNDPGDEAYLEGSAIDELISHWGYETDPNGIEDCLTLYGLNLEFDEETGEITSEDGIADDRWYYRGIITVDNTDYDYWEKAEWGGNTGEFGYMDQNEQYSEKLFFLTDRIVSGEPIITTTTVETVISLEPKGVIYRMIDEFGNDCPYDFKNIQFIRYELTAPETDDKEPWMAQLSTNIQALFSNNELPYIWGGFGHDVIRYWEDEYETIYSTPTGNKKAFFTFSTVIDGVVTDHSILQGYCYDNTMKEYISFKKQYLNNNVFLNTSKIHGCYSNSFGNDCHNNSFGDWCYNNSFGNNCHSNSFGTRCHSNSFGNSCRYNSFGSRCSANSFGNSCYSNSFRGSCNSNSFGNICYYNSFGDECSSNSFGNGCNGNSFGYICGSNAFANDCDGNFFGNECYNNSFGNECHSNSFGDYCYNNSFANNCDGNSFGNDCYGNSFGNDCYGNSFRVDGSQTAKLKDYVRYNHFDNRCSYNVIWNGDTTSSSIQLKNINVNRGVIGTDSSYNYINIDTLNQDYEIQVAKNSKGEIKIYCEADLIL